MRVRIPPCNPPARVAQRPAQLPYKQETGGSSPPVGTTRPVRLTEKASGYEPDGIEVRIPDGAPHEGMAERPGGGLQNRIGRFDSCCSLQPTYPAPLSSNGQDAGLLSPLSGFDSSEGLHQGVKLDGRAGGS